MNRIIIKSVSYKRRVLQGCAIVALMHGHSAFADENSPVNEMAVATQGSEVVLMAQVTTDEVKDPEVVPSTIADKEVEEKKVDDEVVVVGSRLRNDAFTSALPIQVLTAETGELLGASSVQELIRQSTLLTGSIQADDQQAVSAIGGTTTNGGNGTNTLSLRGLGAQRTLVLLNGRRLSPTGNRGGVSAPDISIIPSSIISRVEILKDGASSVYGSDAVAGVIDNRTVGSTNQSSVTGFSRLTEDGGGEFFQVSGRFGREFDKGHFNISAQYDRSERLRIGDRDYTDCRDPLLFDPSTGERKDIRDANGDVVCTSFGSNNRFFIFRGGTGNFFDVNSINGRFAGLYIPDPNGTIVGPGQTELRGVLPEFARVGIQNLGIADPNNTFGVGSGDFAAVEASNALLPQTSDIIQNSNARNPQKRFSLFASGGYELNDNVELYGQALHSRIETDINSFRFLFRNLSGQHPSNTVGPRIRAATNGALFGNIGFNIHRPYVSNDKTNYTNVVGGAKGSFGDSVPFLNGWDWDVYAQLGVSDASYTSNFTRNDRLLATTSFNRDANGNVLGCDTSFINTSLLEAGQTAQSLCDSIGGAIPYLSTRILRDGQFNAAESAFLEGSETGTTKYTQSVLEGFVSGDLLSLPAGDVGAVFGFHLQYDEMDDRPGANSLASNNHNFSNQQLTKGNSGLREVFGELGVPILKDKPLFQQLNLSLSGRYTDNTRIDDGGEFTYKVGANWQVAEPLRFRGSFGTSYRTPALFELFQGGSASFGASDPCARLDTSGRNAAEISNLRQNCALLGITDGTFAPTVNVRTLNQGNNSGTLRAETSQSLNLGVVINPSFANISFAVDYFDIEITDQIGRIGAGAIIERCLVEQSFSSLADLQANQFCSLLQPRDANNNLTDVINGSINIAEQSTRGIDYNVRFNHSVGVYDFHFDGQVTQVLEDFFNQDRNIFDPVNDDIDQTLLGLRPEFTGNFNFSVRKGPWTAFWSTQYVGSSDQLEAELIDPNTGFDENSVRQVFGSYRFLGPLRQDIQVEEYFRHSVSFRYNFENGVRLNAGVSNVFNQAPPQVGGFVRRIGTSAAGPYDFRGRSYFFRATKFF